MFHIKFIFTNNLWEKLLPKGEEQIYFPPSWINTVYNFISNRLVIHRTKDCWLITVTNATSHLIAVLKPYCVLKSVMKSASQLFETRGLLKFSVYPIYPTTV